MKTVAVVRSWKKDQVLETVRSLLAITDIDYVVVAVNADVQNNGESFGFYTRNLLDNSFGDKWPKNLIVHSVMNWGKNPGSAAALNEAVTELFYRLNRLPDKHDIILNVSVESRVTHKHVGRAVDCFKRLENLAVVGISRKIFIGEDEADLQLAAQLQGENRLQYLVPQNTAAFWRADLLRLAGGFRAECDFSNIMITIDDKDIPIAGMEDFPTLCHLAKIGYNWAMIEDGPMVWDLSDIKKSSDQWQKNLDKIERQGKTMELWAQKFFGQDIKAIVAELKSKKLSI